MDTEEQIEYILEYMTSRSERTFKYKFSAKSDDDAVTRGKTLFFEKAREENLNGGATLEAIYRTPTNLLSERVVISETSEKDSPLVGGLCSEDLI